MANVTLDDVNKVYRSGEEEVLAVEDLNLDVQDGEFMCILGPSGCGKTSTLRMIVGLEEITSGEIYFDDLLVNDLSPQEREVAMAFETYALYPHLSVRENITFPLKARGVGEKVREQKLEEVVEVLQISDILDRAPNNLSGGQQQRVSLGRALIRDPAVFLLDEPLSHLDVSQKIEVRSRIKRLHSRMDNTMIYVTHDQLEAIALADRIAVMNFAELEQVGTRSDLLDNPVNTFVADFIGEPPINFVDSSLEVQSGQYTLRFKEGDYELTSPDDLRGALNNGQQEDLTLGIRPHDLVAEDIEECFEFEGEVEIFEFLGEENHVTLNIGGEEITAVVGTDKMFKEGEKVRLCLPFEDLHVFDAETGKRLSK